MRKKLDHFSIKSYDEFYNSITRFIIYQMTTRNKSCSGEPTVLTVITVERSVTRFSFPWLAVRFLSRSRPLAAQPENTSDSLIGRADSLCPPASHNLTAWRARKLITRMCTSKFIWIPVLHAHWLPHSYIRVMSNTKTGCKITMWL